jgi:hypothetical protein
VTREIIIIIIIIRRRRRNRDNEKGTCLLIDIISANADPSVCGLWHRSAATRLLGLRVRIPPVEWIFES